ncbi:MAG: trigger factor [Patescibacteria group bacterium]|nr:trigger factor [Patescibacteria group bacterium]
MQITKNNLPKSLVEITIELSTEEFEPHLKEAAKKISSEHKFEGFRPGNAPYDVVKNRVGEGTIYETALEHGARKILAEVCQKENINPVGHPEFDILKLVPKNPVSFKVTIPVLPKVIELADYEKLEIKKKEAKIKDEDIEKVLKDLQKMQTVEKETDKSAGKEDKVVIDMSISVDNVPIDGGDSKDYGVYLSEEHYIPGFNEKLVGIKKDETKEFKLKFPKEHYQKNFAGKEADFKVTCKNVFELTLPPVDDKLAEKMGQKTLNDLKDMIRKNMQSEAETKESQRQEIEMLEKISEKSKFEDVPEVLLNNEVERMLEEIKNGITKQGMLFEDYLKQINKTIIQLKLDFTPQAVKRIKTSLVIREIAQKENIKVDEKEIAEAIEKEMDFAKEDAEKQKQIRTPEYADYMRAILTNRKVIELLKSKIVK